MHSFLTRMSAETDDKLVLISNFTTTLDVLAKLCDSKKCVQPGTDVSHADISVSPR